MCRWVRDLGKFRTSADVAFRCAIQRHGEKTFSLQKIIAGEFDVDLRAWAREAKAFGSPVLIEWGTNRTGSGLVGTANGNAAADEGPKRYIAALSPHCRSHAERRRG